MSTFDPTVRTSRVFQATLAVYDAVAAATFTNHPTSGRAPNVYLGRDPTHEDNEYIAVTLGNPDAARTEWVRVGGAGRDELFVVDVLIRSAVAGVAARDVVTRLWALADVVQLLAYDVAEQKPQEFTFDNEVVIGRAANVLFEIDETPERATGFAVVSFALQARI